MSPTRAADGLPEEVLSELCGLDSPGIREIVRSRAELLSPITVEHLAEAVRQRVRVDVGQALRLADAAVAIARELSSAESLGRGYRAKANALWFNANFEGAVELFETAIAQFETAGRADEVGRTLSSSIQPLALLGRYEDASRAAERAREIFVQLGDTWRLARVELNAANLHHRQDRFAEALSGYEKAYQQLLPYKDAEALGGALHNMAVCLIMLNDFDRALGCYRTARELLTQNSMPLLVAQADYNIAYLFYLRGDYQKAIEGLRGTRRLCQQNGDRYHAGLCNLDESEIYLELNLADEAAQMSREACRQFEELQAGHELGRSVAHLAIASHRQKNNVRSLNLLEKAKSIFAKENNDAWQALIDLYQALVLFDTGSCAPAERMCSQALEFFERSGLDRRAILCHLLLARISLATGNLLEARRNCDVAIGKLERMEAPLLKYHANLVLGRIQYAASEWRLAYECYNKARVELETLRGHLQGEELKIAFVKNRMDVYQGLVDLCLRKSSTSAHEEAFDYIERAKSRTLAELLVKMPTQHGDPQDERIAVLRGDLNWYYHRIETEQTRKDGISPQNIQRLRAEAHAKEDEFLNALRALQHDKDRAALPWASDVMTLEQIRAKLPREATLLEYFQIGSRFVAAVVTREDLKIVQLAASASEVAGHLQMLEFQLSKFLWKKSTRNSKRDLGAATEDRLRRLYEDLIAPLAPFLREGHLILVPHGILHLLPFQALSNKGEALIDRFPVSFAPSASIFAICQNKPPVGKTGSLLLGVTDRMAPSIRREILSVAAVVPEPRVFFGRRATIDALRTEGPISQIIHIATHGYFRSDNPAFSSVRLADSYLSLYDLYNMNLAADLFTLSGCGTGLNGIAAGDEPLGLTRGLLCAGAQTLLLTLWDVHDHTTAEFMESFYGHLRLKDKPTALRAAMLDLRERYPHPYHWAPFVLVGKVFDNVN